MTSALAREIQRAAAQAALAHPQVAALQPTLADRLTAAAESLHHATRPPAAVRVQRLPTGEGWHVEVRCLVHRDRRTLDVARQIRESIRDTLTTTGLLDPAEHLTVRITITTILRDDSGRATPPTDTGDRQSPPPERPTAPPRP
ncbi:hypothetical protein OG871_37320 [Kitasatospora sp. NBC_00374]|uniref:hypothetical protein n=1 Tax=Kitasatospora sp. NBC_00374 TaxID=2975964 RepID=UPI0030DF6DF7